MIAYSASGDSSRQRPLALMASDAKVYIAGVGYSPDDASGQEPVAKLVSAATKALLDAGVTFEDVTHCVTSKTLSSGSIAFSAFGEGEVMVEKVEAGSELDASIRLVRDRDVQCVLMVAAEKVCCKGTSPRMCLALFLRG